MNIFNKTGDEQRLTMLYWFHLVIIFSSICISSGTDDCTTCDNFYTCADGLCWCKNNEPMVDCEAFPWGDLWFVPKVPENTTVLSISHYNFSVINATTFYNISNIRLEYLELRHNSVLSISKGAFQNLTFLKRLDFFDEPYLKLHELKIAFLSLSIESIKSISLTGMIWKKIDEQLFSYLNDSGLGKIDLSMNKLTELNFKIFVGLKHLFHIDLFQNNLVEVNFAPLENLQILDLHNNGISNVPYPPDFCNNKLHSNYFPRLINLDLSSNKITMLTSGMFKCLPKLEIFRITENPVILIREHFIFYLSSLHYLDISKISANHTSLNTYAFASSSLTTLILDFDDSLYQDFTYFSTDLICKKCPNLINLSLSHTKLPDNKTKLNALFSHSTRIKKLNLSFTEILVLPEVSFSRMTSLKILDLTGNKIRSWNGTQMFSNSTISFLSMKSNRISVLNSTSFPTTMLKYLKKESLDLSENPYLCSCQTLESIKLIRTLVGVLVNYPDGYRCFSPSDVSGIHLMNYNPSAESCAEKDVALLVSVPVSIIAVTTMCVILLVYKCRWRLRYGIYLYNNRHKNFDRRANSDAFQYAGFVIYSDADRKWVHDELIHRLEDEEGFRLCIRLRDFDVGKVHVDNIVDNMSLSEKIIVILSNNFARDEWCDFQLLLAETRLLKQNTDMLVVFILEEISSECLRASLYKLITERQFIHWSNEESCTGNELFWKQAVLQMKKSTVKDYGNMG